jgi:hypothetical protein
MLVGKDEIGYLATEATVLVDAFEGALKELGVADRSDPAALVVAKLIIIFAKAGERDATQLRDLILIAIRRMRQTTSTFCENDSPAFYAS